MALLQVRTRKGLLHGCARDCGLGGNLTAQQRSTQRADVKGGAVHRASHRACQLHVELAGVWGVAEAGELAEQEGVEEAALPVPPPLQTSTIASLEYLEHLPVLQLTQEELASLQPIPLTPAQLLTPELVESLFGLAAAVMPPLLPLPHLAGPTPFATVAAARTMAAIQQQTADAPSAG